MNNKRFAYPLKHMRLALFCEVTGYTPNNIHQMIARGDLAEGLHYRKDPKGNIWIILEGWDKWIEQGHKAA